MRRDSATVVVVVGEVRGPVLAEVGRSANVAVVQPAPFAPSAPSAPSAPAGPAGPQAPGQAESVRTEPPDLDAAAAALAEAARKPSRYVLVAADPLAAVAGQWQAMWNLTATASAGFEARAADALSAWRARRFELPDYYLVLTPLLSGAAEPDLYLGPLRAARPHRVEVVAADDQGEQATAIRRALGQLRHGPWWPPLDEIIDIARGFFPGGQPVP